MHFKSRWTAHRLRNPTPALKMEQINYSSVLVVHGIWDTLILVVILTILNPVWCLVIAYQDQPAKHWQVVSSVRSKNKCFKC